MKKLLSSVLFASLLTGCQGSELLTPQYFVNLSALSPGQWEVVINGVDGWGCKAPLGGRSKDGFNLPAQSVSLVCVGGPANGTATLSPVPNARFTNMSFKLDNGWGGALVLK